jgi:hypothetical protein
LKLFFILQKKHVFASILMRLKNLKDKYYQSARPLNQKLQFQEVKFKIPKAEQRVLHEREVEQAAARKGPSPTASETSESNKIQAIYRNHHSMPWSYYEQAPMTSGGLGSRPESPPNNFMNMMMGNNKPMNRKRQRPSRYVVSRLVLDFDNRTKVF